MQSRAVTPRPVWALGAGRCLHRRREALFPIAFKVFTVRLQPDPAELFRNVSPQGEIDIEPKWGEMVQGVGAFTTPISTMAEHRERPLGSTSAATSPCSTMKDRDGGGGRGRRRRTCMHANACAFRPPWPSPRVQTSS